MSTPSEPALQQIGADGGGVTPTSSGSLPAAAAVVAGLSGEVETMPEVWHEVWATAAVDPVTGQDVIILTQMDVTGKVTLLFADIKGFTPMCKELEPPQVMEFLNNLYSRFDAMLDVHGVYKVETIGDCYFVAGGLIREDEDGMPAVQAGDQNGEDPLHAVRVFTFAKAMLAAAREVALPTTGQPVEIRIGIHTGPVVSGVVGTRMPRFCLFGDTVATANLLERTGVPGAVHVSDSTYRRLDPDEPWKATGGVEVKGKGQVKTYLWCPSNHQRNMNAAPQAPSPDSHGTYGTYGMHGAQLGSESAGQQARLSAAGSATEQLWSAQMMLTSAALSLATRGSDLAAAGCSRGGPDGIEDL
ncbi:hypothetical protein GPECTOR_9g568 [Gonium pectorale]|uniref:Guanylate cyclase domain-containing protein n=1 Tax=Gonium pectorale TaxID=33097 RepID=A0A150GRW4_GONPE|nr:hypothetical protein GPECTOR_9g568 [Gonium pectorale]|eukprot:KXZ52524.1 hypothetical protein GPECTOR_9g568 [Gonium pectorale]